MNDISNPNNPSTEATSPSQPLPPNFSSSVTPLPATGIPAIDPLSANPNPADQASTQIPPPSAPFANPAFNQFPTQPTQPQPQPQPQPSNNTGSNFATVIWALALGIFNWLVVPAAIVLILHFFVFQAFHVVGRSMVPTLDQSDYLIISKVDASLSRLSRLWGRSGAYIPKRDEIIVFRYPGDPSKIFVKRVLATPGERIVVKGGKVTVYNATHPEGISPDQGHQVSDPITLGDVDEVVQPGKVFVMGDNRAPNGSFDSRDWGALPSDRIIGKALFRLLPLNKFKVIGTN